MKFSLSARLQSPAPRLAAALLLAALAGCSLTGQRADPQARRVTVEGHSYLLSPLTAGTWTATPVGPGVKIPPGNGHRAALVGALESASGCKVTDNNLAGDSAQLDAQVDCGNAPN